MKNTWQDQGICGIIKGEEKKKKKKKRFYTRGGAAPAPAPFMIHPGALPAGANVCSYWGCLSAHSCILYHIFFKLSIPYKSKKYSKGKIAIFKMIKVLLKGCCFFYTKTIYIFERLPPLI